jgi:hypothetical protein
MSTSSEASKKYRTLSLARLGIVTLIILLLFGLILASCGTPPTTGPLKVTTVWQTTSISQIGLVSANASCAPGQQLLGGGYEITQPLPSSNVHNDYPLVVEGSYPSPPNVWNTWTAEVYNPDPMVNNIHHGNSVTAFAYCAMTPNFPLGIQVKYESAQIHYLQNPATSYYNSTQVNSSCPPNSALTGGGFRNQPEYPPTIAIGEHKIEMSHVTTIESAPVVASVPFPSLSHPSWSVTGVDSGATLTAYALCATQNLTTVSPTLRKVHMTGEESRRVMVDDSSSTQIWRYYEGTVSCGPNQLATGGGYTFPNANLWTKIIWPKAVWRDMADKPSLSTWIIDAGYEFRTDMLAYDDDILHPTLEGMQVYLTCIQAKTV